MINDRIRFVGTLWGMVVSSAYGAAEYTLDYDVWSAFGFMLSFAAAVAMIGSIRDT